MKTKNNLIIIVISLILIFTISIFFFQKSNPEVTGNVVLETTTIEETTTTETLEVPSFNPVIIGTQQSSKPAGAGTGGGSGGSESSDNQTQQVSCFNNVNVGYDLDYKDTRLTTDDDFYLKIINNDNQEYMLTIYVNNNLNSALSILPLSQAISLSSQLTDYWHSLNQATTETFTITLEITDCKQDYQITVSYPPDDSAYYD